MIYSMFVNELKKLIIISLEIIMQKNLLMHAIVMRSGVWV